MTDSNPYFLMGDLAIRSDKPLAETADSLARSLGIQPFAIDTSGKWEGDEVLTSQGFGMQFMLCEPAFEVDFPFGLSIQSLDDLDYDGDEDEVDVAAYAAALINRAGDVKAAPVDFSEFEPKG